MSELICANCGTPIHATYINIQTDLAKCVKCNSIHRASELLEHKPKRKKTKSHQPVSMNPPLGSNMDIYELPDGTVEMVLPPVGLKGAQYFMMFFAIFWISFITVWTGATLWGGVYFMTLFSIPFWFAGFKMVQSIINSLVEKQTIRVYADRLEIVKKRFPAKKHKVIYFDAITKIDHDELPTSGFDFSYANNTTNFNNKHKESKLKTSYVQSGVDKISFFEAASEPEQKWSIAVLKELISQETGAPKHELFQNESYGFEEGAEDDWLYDDENGLRE